MKMARPQQLLFFDTFIHDLEAELNVDLVQFPNPVIVDEVRVIPLGARVEANFPGGVRLGATNPTQFQLDLYVNALATPGVPTFQSLGTLHYNHKERIQLKMSKEVATDGLVLHGMYNAITLAVYGTALQETAAEIAARAAAAAAAAAASANADDGRLAASASAAVMNHESKPPPSHHLDDDQWYRQPVLQPPPPGHPISQPPPPMSHQQPPPSWNSGGPAAYDVNTAAAPHHVHVHPNQLNGSGHAEDPMLHHHHSAPPSLPHHHQPPPSHSHHHPHHHHQRPAHLASPPPAHPLDHNHASYQHHQRDRRMSSPPQSSHLHRGEHSSSRDYPPRARRSTSGSRSPQAHHHHHDSNNHENNGPANSSGVAPSGGESVLSTEDNMLDDMSDISEGDIPDVGDDEKCADKGSSERVVNRNSVQSDVGAPDDALDEAPPEGFTEEISDDEADWSDDGIVDMDVEFGDDWEDPIKIFDPFQAELTQQVAKRVTFTFGTDHLEDLVGASLNQEWIEKLEGVTAELANQPGSVVADERTANALHSLSLMCLSIDQAMRQEVATMKVRHMKSGLAFAKALFMMDGETALKMLRMGLQHRTMALFETELMAPSIKLMAVALLDETISRRLGFEIATDRKAPSDYDEKKRDKSIHESLWDHYAASSTRIRVALAALLRKMGIFETALKVRLLCREHFSSGGGTGSESNGVEDGSSNLEEHLVPMLEELSRALKKAEENLAQPKRYLPHRLDTGRDHGASGGVLRIFEETRLLDSLLMALSWPDASSSLSTNCQALLREILNAEGGFAMLSRCHKPVNNLIKLLFTSEEQSVGARLCYTVQAEQCVAKLMAADPHDIRSLVDLSQNLHSLTYSAQGQQFVAQVLYKGSVFAAILGILKRPPPETDVGKFSLNAVKGYLKEVLSVTIRRQPAVPREHPREMKPAFSALAELAALPDQKDYSLSQLAHLVQPYLDCIELDVKALATSVEKGSENVNPVGRHLLATVRTLYATLGEFRGADSAEKMACLHLYSNGIADHYLNLLSKICTHHEQPSLHTASFAGVDCGYDLLSLVSCMLRTLRRIFACLIVSRDMCYADTSPLQPLIRCYAFLAAVPSTSPFAAVAQDAMDDVKRILCNYTEPTFEQKVSDSMWTRMASEVIEFACFLPHQHFPGLKLLSELLPLPLPIQTKEQLGDEDKNSVFKARKLWSAHLYPIEDKIRTMFKTIVPVSGGGSDQVLPQTLKRVAIQLTDLSVPIAQITCEAILDSMDLEAPQRSSSVSRVCTFLSTLLEDCEAAKAVVVSLFEEKRLEQFETLCGLLHREDAPVAPFVSYAVCSVVQDLCDPELTLSLSETSSEEYLTQSLPSPRLLDVIVESFAKHLAQTSDRLAQPDSLAAPTTILRTLGMLCEHDYGYARVWAAIEKHQALGGGGLFSNLLEAILLQNLSASDVAVTCLSNLMMLAQSLYSMPSGEQFLKPRTLCLCKGQVLAALSTEEDIAESEEGEEPKKRLLERMAEKVEAIGENGEDVKKMTSEVAVTASEVANLLLAEKIPTEEEKKKVPEIPGAVEKPALSELYGNREVSAFSDYPKLSAADWLSDCAMEEVHAHVPAAAANKRVDLTDICTASLSKEFDLTDQLRVVCEEKGLGLGGGVDGLNGVSSPAKRKAAARKSVLERRALQNKNIISHFKAGGGVGLGSGLLGRGFSRAGGGGGHQRPDGFRSRPPNTSRPPSLHVDDFLVLQQRGQQPTGPTGYNKQSIKAAKELFAQREAAQQQKASGATSIVGFREATKEPVYDPSDRPFGAGRGGGPGRRDGFPRGGGGRRGRGGPWSTDGMGGRFANRRGGGSPWRGSRDRRQGMRDDRFRYGR